MQKGLFLFSGQSALVFSEVHRLLIPLVLKGYRVHIIDCAIRLNLFVITEECQRRHLPVDFILNQITVQRLFTPYQILTVTKNLNPEILPVFLAPHKQFFDGDVAFGEALFLLEKLYQFWFELSQKQILWIAEKQSYPNPIFRSLFPKLCQKAKYHKLIDTNSRLLLK